MEMPTNIGSVGSGMREFCGRRRRTRRDTQGLRDLGPTLSLDFAESGLHPSAMKFILTTHNVTLTKAIEDHILALIWKLESLDRFAINARVMLEHDTTKPSEKQFKCSVRLEVPGPDLFAVDTEAELYSAIDLVFKKIEQQIRKRHSKFKTRAFR